MVAAWCEKISLYLHKNEIIPEDSVEIYTYGLEVIFSVCIGFLSIFLIGIIFQMPLLSMLYYAVFLILRQFTGGYHAKTFFTCNLTLAYTTAIVFALTKLTVILGVYTLGIHLSLLFLSIIIIWACAPIENENKPLSDKKKYRCHWIGFIITVILSIISSVFLYYNLTIISALITFTLSMISVMVVVALSKEREEVDRHE